MIIFQNVSKVYANGAEALRDVNLEIGDGEFVFIIGESGAGKSTLIKLLSCEENPTEGRVLVDDYEISRMSRRLVPQVRRKIGMIFQDYRLIESKTVFENVAMAMEIVGARPKQIKQRVNMLLSMVGLRHKTNDYPDELSGGEQQRVGVARAMANNPRLILADEPTGNLDPTTSEATMAMLDEINKMGATVIVCSHNIELIKQMNKRTITIHDGQVVNDEPASSEEQDLCLVRSEEDREQMQALFSGFDFSLWQKEQEENAEAQRKRRQHNNATLAERIASLRFSEKSLTSEDIAEMNEHPHTRGAHLIEVEEGHNSNSDELETDSVINEDDFTSGAIRLDSKQKAETEAEHGQD